MKFKVYSLINNTASEKIWKTYNGALKNCKFSTDIVITPEGIEWCKKHPEWDMNDLLERFSQRM